jgi:hypothetical protein
MIPKIYKLDTKLLKYSYKSYSTKRHKKSYSKELGVIYANFTIALLHNKLNLDRTKFKNYSNIIKFLEEYKGDKLFTSHYISQLRKIEFKKVPLTDQSLDFINYVKKTFPEFNEYDFYYKPSNTYPMDQQAKAKTAKATEVTTKATNLSTTYPNDQKAKTANHSLRSIYL